MRAARDSQSPACVCARRKTRCVACGCAVCGVECGCLLHNVEPMTTTSCLVASCSVLPVPYVRT